MSRQCKVELQWNKKTVTITCKGISEAEADRAGIALAPGPPSLSSEWRRAVHWTYFLVLFPVVLNPEVFKSESNFAIPGEHEYASSVILHP